jgi:hypothetical protein
LRPGERLKSMKRLVSEALKAAGRAIELES